MAIQRWNPYGEMHSLRSVMDQLMQDAFVWPDAPGMQQSSRSLPLDVIERDNELIVKASLPGVKPEDVNVSVQGNNLTITGETRSEDDKNGTVHHRENHWGRFTRSITFPTQVDAGKCEATFEHGMLTLTLPKAETSRVRRIPINGQPQQQQIEATATRPAEKHTTGESHDRRPADKTTNGKQPEESRR